VSSVLVACLPRPGGWTCQVEVIDGASATDHRVTVEAADLQRLAPGTTDPTDLVRRSFAFLLEREPKESILGAFDLTVIGRYFPDWEAWIRG
jgi:hypothetical protein